MPDIKTLLMAGYDVLNSKLDPRTKKILLQIGNVVTQTVTSDGVEQWSHYGYAYRAPKPDPASGQAAQVILLRQADHDIALASQDMRGLDLYGDLDYGDVCVYSAGVDGKGQARIFVKSDGSVSMYTRKGNVPGATGMTMQLDAQGGVASVLNDKGYGLIAGQDGVLLTSGDASLELNADGSGKLICKQQLQADGSSIILGSAAVPGVNSALVGVTGLVGVASTKVLIALV